MSHKTHCTRCNSRRVKSFMVRSEDGAYSCPPGRCGERRLKFKSGDLEAVAAEPPSRPPLRTLVHRPKPGFAYLSCGHWIETRGPAKAAPCWECFVETIPW